MLDFNKRELKFKYDGQEQILKFPTLKMLGKYQSEYKKAEKEGNEVKMTLNFLCELGLEEKVADELEASHVEKLMGELTKKN